MTSRNAKAGVCVTVARLIRTSTKKCAALWDKDAILGFLAAARGCPDDNSPTREGNEEAVGRLRAVAPSDVSSEKSGSRKGGRAFANLFRDRFLRLRINLRRINLIFVVLKDLNEVALVSARWRDRVAGQIIGIPVRPNRAVPISKSD